MVERATVERLDYANLPTGRHEFRVAAAHLPDGGTLAIPVTVLVGRRAHPRLVAIAGVHGNEYPGPLALLDLLGKLHPVELHGTIAIVPIANPLAFNAGSRVSPEDAVNLNRVFPGNPDGSLTHRLARTLVDDIVQDADLAIDLHSAEATGRMMPMGGFRERSDETARVSARAAAAFGLEMFWMMRWAPGTLSTALNERGIPAIGAELGGAGVASAEEVALYRGAVERCIAHLGIHGDPPPALVPPTAEVMDDIVAPTSGLYTAIVGMRDPIEVGQTIGHIRDPWGSVVATVASHLLGRVVHERLFRQVRTGDTLVSIGHHVANPAL